MTQITHNHSITHLGPSPPRNSVKSETCHTAIHLKSFLQNQKIIFSIFTFFTTTLCSLLQSMGHLGLQCHFSFNLNNNSMYKQEAFQFQHLMTPTRMFPHLCPTLWSWHHEFHPTLPTLWIESLPTKKKWKGPEMLAFQIPFLGF